MRYLCCQICGQETPDRPDERHLWLVASTEPISEGETTPSPPVHERCAAQAVRDCPHLRNHVAALVDAPLLWGVAGLVYDPDTLDLLPDEGNGSTEDGLTLVAYTDPRLRWTVAAQTVLALHDCEPVDLHDLITAA
ncbi:hypothetical protein [Streptomyces qinglanensis]|uniref:hypothetical protein n=1 Tax=Streptomyces qinglanensis TaxID=943816 RepID=UPI003D70915E